MKFILEFARFRDIVITNNKKIKKLSNVKFKDDARLVFDIYIKKYNKNIILKWNHKETHSIIDRIKNRTSFISTSEFNTFIINSFQILFDDYFNEIDKTARYSVYFPINNFYLILDINYDNLFQKYTIIFIPSITTTKGFNVYKNFVINDDLF